MPVKMTPVELLIKHDQLLALMRYEPEEGQFYWLVRRNCHGGPIMPGDRVKGYVNGDGYKAISIGGRRYPAARLAWFYVHGVWPTGEVDHINRIPSDNRILNLRDTPNRRDQRGNQKPHKDNMSGLKGVSKNYGRGKPWRARCIRRTLGYFDTPFAAHEAYMKEARRVFGEYARSGE